MEYPFWKGSIHQSWPSSTTFENALKALLAYASTWKGVTDNSDGLDKMRKARESPGPSTERAAHTSNRDEATESSLTLLTHYGEEFKKI